MTKQRPDCVASTVCCFSLDEDCNGDHSEHCMHIDGVRGICDACQTGTERSAAIVPAQDDFGRTLAVCEACGEPQALCTLCNEEARHFLCDEAPMLNHGYLCDSHAQPFLDAYEAGEYRFEIGAYAAVDECSCDSWR